MAIGIYYCCPPTAMSKFPPFDLTCWYDSARSANPFGETLARSALFPTSGSRSHYSRGPTVEHGGVLHYVPAAADRGGVRAGPGPDRQTTIFVRGVVGPCATSRSSFRTTGSKR